jgi:hypothetical protein
VPRTLRLVIPLLFLAPSAAQAGDVTMVVRDVPLHARRALAVAAPRFNMVGLHWQGSGTPLYRTRSLGGRWSAWTPGDDDWGRDGVWRKGNPDWTGPANAIQIRTIGRVTRVREYLLWSPPVLGPPRRLQLAGSPAIVSRSGWQADESIRRAPPVIAPTLQFALVHHTVNTNGYPCSESASIVRGIMVYHVQGNGWNDIGYNFLVDHCGTVFEGRYGGIDKNVVGAHSQGFNTGSVGVALIGTYDTVTPPQAQLDALVKLLAWRLDVAHIDPLSFLNYISGGNTKFAAGLPVDMRAISGHRDTYFTDCPGDALYRLLPSLAQQVAKTGTPKLYAPGVAGTFGGPIRFTGRVSEPLPWTVTVTDPTGKVVAAGAGTGTAVDWTWDSKSAPPGVVYTWVLSAGSTVRPATGTIGSKLVALTLTKVVATPAIIDGTVATSATIAYTLSVPASVTAELLNSVGTAIATLFTEDKQAGAQSFVFTPTGVPDGNYSLRLTAHDRYAREAQALVAVTVSRTLLGFTVDSSLVSPNGDGRRDTVTFGISLAQAADVTLALQLGTTSIPIFVGNLLQGNQELPWAGVAADGTTVPDGAYTATLTLGTPPLAVSRSVPLTVDTRPPTLVLVSLFPLRLKTDERATIFAVVNGHRFTTSAKPGVFRLAQPATLRTLRVVARDAAGNDSRLVTYPHSRR